MYVCELVTASQPFRFTLVTYPKASCEGSSETSSRAWVRDGCANDKIR